MKPKYYRTGTGKIRLSNSRVSSKSREQSQADVSQLSRRSQISAHSEQPPVSRAPVLQKGHKKQRSTSSHQEEKSKGQQDNRSVSSGISNTSEFTKLKLVLSNEKDSQESRSEREKSSESLQRIHTFNLRNNPVTREKKEKKELMIDIGLVQKQDRSRKSSISNSKEVYTRKDS